MNREPSQIEETPSSTEAIQAVSEPSMQVAPSNDNADTLHNPILRARSGRGILNVLMAICAGVAATTAWYSYGEEAKQQLSHVVPQLVVEIGEEAKEKLSQVVPQLLTETPPSTQGANAAKAQDTAAPSAAPPSTAEPEPAQQGATAPQPTPPADTATTQTQAPPAQPTLPAETAKSLETMASDIAALKQAVDDLRTSEQQLRQELSAEREARTRPVQHRAKSALPRRQRTSPQAAIPYSPAPSPAPATQVHPQGPIRDAYVPPPTPVPAQLPPQPGDVSAPRPPMPLR